MSNEQPIITDQPQVSIIIPAYNAEKYIQRALKSTLNQAYNKIEIIVIDDGSIDGTATLIKSFRDPRIIYLYQKNSGQGAARNHGVRVCNGEYITFLDADDAYLPSKVEEQVMFFRMHPEYDVVYCSAFQYYSQEPDRLYRKKGHFPSGDIFPELLKSSLINPNTIMISRKIVDDGIMFSEAKEGRYFDDWSYYLKISRAGYKFGYLDRPLVKVEMREDSHTQWEIQWIMKKACLEYFEKLFSQMSENEQKKYDAERILRDKKFKLSMAYLVAGLKKESFNIIKNIVPRILIYPIGIIMVFLPSCVLKGLLIWVWKIKQKASFSRAAVSSCHVS